MKIVNLNEAYVDISSLTDGNVNVDADISKNKINSYLIEDLKTVSRKTGVKIQITTAKSDHPESTKSGNVSRHSTNQAVDIARLNGQGSKGASNDKNGSAQFRVDGNKIKDELVKLGYDWNKEGKSNRKSVLWQMKDHYNHLHVSNTTGEGSVPVDDTNDDGTTDPVNSPTTSTTPDREGLGIADKVLDSFTTTLAVKKESTLSESVKDEINLMKRLM